MEPKRVPRKATILAVDDKRANLLALDALLGQEYAMLYANSGAEALSILLKAAEVDLILMDVQMPGLDGFETASRIKKMQQCQDIPIIFITAVYSDDPYIKKGYEVGGIDYFSKPFDPEILKLKVAIYASFRQRADLLRERERHIRESEELLRVGRRLSSVLERLPIGVLIADNEGRICQTTEEVSRIFRSGEQAAHDTYGEILGWWNESGHMIKDAPGPLGAALQGEERHSEAVTIRCLDGTEKTILGSAAPLRALDGRIVGAVVLIQDLTEGKRIERDLERRVTRLVALGVELEESTAR
jgi:response regulator RpfG family c-di-GMP phosphodiesterase